MNYQELREFLLRVGEGETSNVYQAIKDALVGLGEVDPANIKNLAEYRTRLGKVIDACDIYEKDKVNKVETDNEERARYAKEMRQYLTDFYNRAIEQEQKEIIKANFDEAKKLPRVTVEDFNQIAKLQKNIGVTKIKAKTTQITRNQSKPRDIWNYIKHGLYTAIQTVSNVTIGGLIYLASIPFTRTGKYEQRVRTEYDPDIIPGTKGEKFEDLTEKVNGGAPDQPIIADKRRIPVVFEREILEDPNEGPTVTFNFHQATEGRSIGYDKHNRMGHGFITLKYTRVNPITGKKQRYESTFGFYPKGGFIGLSQTVGGVLNGMSVPGQLNDDFNHEVSMKKTVPATNQQINKIILAAQGYEKDGYNPVTRNCASFVHDMGEASGLDVSFMKETDIEIEENLKMGTGLLLGGPMFSRVGKYYMLKRADHDDYSYQRFGQKMLNKEDILRLDKREYNIRMKGFVPSRIAEVLRAEQGSDLSHNTIVEPSNKANDFSYAIKNLTTEIDGLIIQLNTFATKYKGSDMETVNNRLASYLYTKNLSFKKLVEMATTGKEVTGTGENKKTRDLTFKEKREVLEKLTKESNECIEQMTKFYHESYKGLPELNLTFQRFVGNFYNLKKLAHDGFVNLESTLLYTKGEKNDKAKEEDYLEYIDPTRDDSESIKSILFEEQKYSSVFGSQGVKVDKATVVAGIKIFGSSKEFIRLAGLKCKRDNDKTLDPKDVKNPLTEEQLKEVALYEKKTMHFHWLREAEMSILGGRELTANDYKYYLVDLPEQEKTDAAYLISDKDSNAPSKDFQMVALNRIFGGLKKKLSEITYEQIVANPDIVKEVLSNHLADKIKENSKEFNKLTQGIFATQMAETPFDEAKDDPATYKRELMIKTYEKFEGVLRDTYLDPLLNTARKNIVKNVDGITYNQRTEIESIFAKAKTSLTEDPKTASYREAILDKIGYQPGFRAYRGTNMVEVGKAIERKNFPNIPENRTNLGNLLATEEAILMGKRADGTKGELNKEYIEKRGQEFANAFKDSTDEEFFNMGKSIVEPYLKVKNRTVNKFDVQVVTQAREKLSMMKAKKLEQSKNGLDLGALNK